MRGHLARVTVPLPEGDQDDEHPDPPASMKEKEAEDEAVHEALDVDITVVDTLRVLLLPYQAICVVVLFTINLLIHAGVGSIFPWIWPSWFLQRTATSWHLYFWTCLNIWCLLPWAMDIALEMGRRVWRGVL